jgi:hypothetical protein
MSIISINKKLAIICALIFSTVISLPAQTYFSLRLGGGGTDINRGERFQELTPGLPSEMEDQIIPHWSIGLGIEHQLSEMLFLSWTNSYYNNRSFELYVPAFVPYLAHRFDSWRSDLAIKGGFADMFLVGSGLGLNHIHDMEFSYDRETFFDGSVVYFDAPYFEYTAHLSFAYYYKRYMLELSYIKGLGYRDKEERILQPINELNLTLIVQFKSPWADKARRRGKLRF